MVRVLPAVGQSISDATSNSPKLLKRRIFLRRRPAEMAFHFWWIPRSEGSSDSHIKTCSRRGSSRTFLRSVTPVIGWSA